MRGKLNIVEYKPGNKKIMAFLKNKTNTPRDSQRPFYHFLKVTQKNEMLKVLFLLKKGIACFYGRSVAVINFIVQEKVYIVQQTILMQVYAFF